MNETKKKTLWQRLREKYRISVLSEDTLTERWHLHLSWWGAIVLLAVLFITAFALFYLAILYTPIKSYLPGYSENIRQQLIEESTLVDSLGTSLELQRQYLNTLTQVIAGEAPTDSIQSLDSMQIIMKEKLLEAKSEATAEFIAQYEETEKDNLQLFETVQAANTSHPTNFISPIHGTITTPYEPLEGNNSITITSFGNKNASAVMEGTIIHITYDINTLYTITVQHSQFVSIYTNLEQPLKDIGEHVKAGEAIAIVHNLTLGFQLWKNGETINPEEFIIF